MGTKMCEIMIPSLVRVRKISPLWETEVIAGSVRLIKIRRSIKNNRISVIAQYRR